MKNNIDDDTNEDYNYDDDNDYDDKENRIYLTTIGMEWSSMQCDAIPSAYTNHSLSSCELKARGRMFVAPPFLSIIRT